MNDVILKKGAKHWHLGKKYGGRLMITKDELIYNGKRWTNSFKVRYDDMIIKIDEIDHIEKRGLELVMLYLKNRNIERFWVWGRDKLIQTILDLQNT